MTSTPSSPFHAGQPLLTHAATGPLDVLRSEVHAALSGDPVAWKATIDAAGDLAVNLAAAVVVFVVTLWASRWAAGLTRQMLRRLLPGASQDATLQGFLSSLVRWVVLIVGLVAVLDELGVRTTSVLALLGAGSLAVGLATQGALANLAAGVMVLVLRPYRVGDTVQISGRIGTVKRLDLFVTELADPDNLAVFVPNGKVFGELIVNYSAPQTRRVELGFGLDYGADVDRALALLLVCAKADERVLGDPAPWSGVTALGDGAVTVTLRTWTVAAAYWDVRYDLLRQAKERLRAGGIALATATPPAPVQSGGAGGNSG